MYYFVILTLKKGFDMARKKAQKEEQVIDKEEIVAQTDVEENEVDLISSSENETNSYDIEEVAEASDALEDAIFYDVDYDRDVFMELRKIMDNAFAKRNKSKEDEDNYDDVVYNLTTKCIESQFLQDFLGYCYKKGKYDFCLMNFEKYMKWTILAGSRGNAFSLSKLQLFFANQLDTILEIPGIELVADNFDLDGEQFIMVLLKKLCDRIVQVLDLMPEKMLKEPEVYVEQTEQLMRKFDKAKNSACEQLKEECEELIKSINKLDDELRRKDEIMREVKRSESEEQERAPEPIQLTEEEMEREAEKQVNSSNKFVKKEPSKKKFRW